jgi:hypothetical protein
MELVGSLPVPNVQSLAAASNGDHVPPRYIRPEASADPVSFNCGDAIPAIDFSRLIDPNLCLTESQLLAQACEEWGFFQVIFNFSILFCSILLLIGNFKRLIMLSLNNKKKFY